MDDSEAEDEVRPDFPCPYCHGDFDIESLLSHLEAEHPCQSKLTICPVCSVKVATDMLSHITQRHGHLFRLQRRRRLHMVGISKSQALSLLGRELCEAHLPVLLGGDAHRSSTANVSNAATDSLHYPPSNFPASEAEEIMKFVVTIIEDTAAEKVAPSNMRKSGFDSSLSYEEREKRVQQATERAGFVQDLLLSTLSND